MTTVLFTTNPQEKSCTAQDQEFFNSFNWYNFQAGDIVWLEDYEADDAKDWIAGIVCRFDFNNPVIRLLPGPAARWLANRDITSVDDIKNKRIRGNISNYMYH